MTLIDHLIVQYNVWKMTTSREGGMIAATRELSFGLVSIEGQPNCYLVDFLFHTKNGKIITFGNPEDIVKKYAEHHNGSSIVAYNFMPRNSAEQDKLYYIANVTLLDECSARAKNTLITSMDKYNLKYGFNLYGYDGFSEGNFVDDDILL